MALAAELAEAGGGLRPTATRVVDDGPVLPERMTDVPPPGPWDKDGARVVVFDVDFPFVRTGEAGEDAPARRQGASFLLMQGADAHNNNQEDQEEKRDVVAEAECFSHGGAALGGAGAPGLAAFAVAEVAAFRQSKEWIENAEDEDSGFGLVFAEPLGARPESRWALVQQLFEQEPLLTDVCLAPRAQLAMMSSGHTEACVVDFSSHRAVIAVLARFDEKLSGRTAWAQHSGSNGLPDWFPDLLTGTVRELLLDDDALDRYKEGKEAMIGPELMRDVAAAVLDSIHSAPVSANLHKQLLARIVVCGYPSLDLMNNEDDDFKQSFENELKAAAAQPSHTSDGLDDEFRGLVLEHAKIIVPPERVFSVWIGGSILGSLSTRGAYTLSREEMEAGGQELLEKKCPTVHFEDEAILRLVGEVSDPFSFSAIGSMTKAARA